MAIDSYRPIFIDSGAEIRTGGNWAASQSNTQLYPAQSGKNIYITHIKFSSAVSSGNYSLVEDTAGTPITIWQPTYLNEEGGENATLYPIFLKASENTDIGITSTIEGNQSINLLGYVAAVDPS